MSEPRLPAPPAAASPAKGGASPAPLPPAALRPRRAASRVEPAEPGDLSVAAALGLDAVAGPVEVYVDLNPEPVRVGVRGGWGRGESWLVAGPVLRGRVLAAIGPLLAAGWQLDGTFNAAARWDVSVATGPDLYQGCWVRMRPAAS